MPKRTTKRHAALWAAQQGLCFYCSQQMLDEAVPAHARRVTADHFIPRRYGADRVNNIVLACFECNNEAGSRMPSMRQAARFKALYRVAGLDAKPVIARLEQYWGAEVAA